MIEGHQLKKTTGGNQTAYRVGNEELSDDHPLVSEQYPMRKGQMKDQDHIDNLPEDRHDPKQNKKTPTRYKSVRA